MKKIIAAVGVAMCSLTANAQFWVGGNVGFSRFENSSELETESESAESKPVRLYFGPKIGYSFNDKWAVALSLSYSHGTNENKASSSDYISKSNQHYFDITPFVRYSFAKSGIVSFHVDGGMTFGYSKSKWESKYNSDMDYERRNPYSDRETNMFNVGLRPGMQIDLSDHVALELNLGFFGYSWHRTEALDEYYDIERNHRSTMTGSDFGLTGNGGDVNLGVIWKF